MLTRVFGLLVAVATASPSVDVVYRAGATECGPEDLIKNQTTVSIHYTVTMPHIDSGRVIDSTREEVPGGRGQPLTLVVGLRLVLPGLDQGLIGLCKGAQVDLTVPPELAYGEKGLREQTRDPATGNVTAGDFIVPPNTTLLIDLDVLDVSQPNVFSVIDSDADGYFSPVDVSDYFKSQNWTEVDGAVESMFERLDMDKDGLVSWDEFDGPKGIKSPFTAKDEL